MNIAAPTETVTATIMIQPTKLEEARIEIYPAIGVEIEYTSFFTRFKKFIANGMANLVCEVANRPYNFFLKNDAPTNMQTTHISVDFPPV